MKLKLLSKTPNTKMLKGLKKGYTTFILYLDPRLKDICKWASPGCKAGCLFTAGRGAMNRVVTARKKKTEWFINDSEGFKSQLFHELTKIQLWSLKREEGVCIRLNGTSDLDFFDLIELFPDLQFYDYTKSFDTWERARTVKNYHVTFSRSENNETTCQTVLKLGGNVAIVFEKCPPLAWKGFRVVDGDETDLRFLDRRNVVVGLKAKGRARKQDMGFVVRKELPMVLVEKFRG